MEEMRTAQQPAGEVAEIDRTFDSCPLSAPVENVEFSDDPADEEDD